MFDKLNPTDKILIDLHMKQLSEKCWEALRDAYPFLTAQETREMHYLHLQSLIFGYYGQNL